MMISRMKHLLVAVLLPAISIFSQTTVSNWPTASEINYGQVLQQSLLTGGEANTAGSFAFVSPSQMPDAGTADYDVVFTPTDTGSYNSVTGSVSVTVQKRTLTVSGATVADKTYDRTTTASISGQTLSNVVSGDSVSFLFFGGAFAQSDAGTNVDVYTYGAIDNTSSKNYIVNYPVLKGSILQKALTVADAVAQDKMYDGTDVAVISNATLSGAISGDDVTLANATSGTFSQSDSGTNIAVSTSMSLGGNSAGNYTLAQPAGLSADITKADQLISDFIPADGTNLLINTTNAISASASSGLPVTFEVVSGPGAFTAETNLYFTGAGEVVLAAHQSGDGNWNAVSSANTITVSKVSQSLSNFLPADGNIFLASDSVGLSADASSGLAVSFAVESGPGSISGGTNLSFSGGGTVVVVASQAGDGTYDAAVSITNSYTVQDSAVITLSDLSYIYDGASHAATVGTTPAELTVDVTYNGSAIAPVAAGSYEVIAVIHEEFYEGAVTNTLVISKATPDTSGVTASPITYGATLEEVFLNKGAVSVPGSFVFETPTLVPPAGSASYDTIFTPTDTANYNVVTQSVSVTVAKRALSVTGASVPDKTYNGTTAATLSGATLSNVVSGDDVALTTANGYFSQADVGTNLSVFASFSLTGDDASNYTLEQLTGLTGNIVAKGLTVSGATAEDKAYDGTTVAVISGAVLVGTVSGDDVSLSGATTGTFAQSNVGTNIAVSTSMSLSGTDKDNYTLTGPEGLGADITQASQSISDFLPSDATNLLVTTTNGLSATASSGLTVTFTVISGDAVITDGTNLSFSAAGTVVIEAAQGGNSNWVAAASVTNTYTVDKAGATVRLSNLAYTYDELSHAATIETTPSDLTVDVTYDGSTNLPVAVGSYEVIATVNDSVYQGTATSSLVISAASASVTLSDLSYTYDGSAHGATVVTDPEGLTVELTYNGSTNVPVAVGSYEVIATVVDDNYEGAATNSLVISKAFPVLSGLSASDLTYGMQLQQSVLSGSAGGVAGSFGFASPTTVPDAGTAGYNVVFTPTDTASYNSATGSVSVTVDQRMLTVSGVSVVQKTYDGTAAATLTGGTLSGVVSGDDVSLANLAGTFSQVTIGTGLAVTPALSLDGTDAANYTLTQPSGLSGSIVAKELTVGSPVAEDKIYDGTTLAVISGVVLSGVVDGDDVSLVDGTVGVFSQSDVGTGIAVTSSMSLSGDDKGNYMLTVPTGLTADITTATQSISSFLPADGATLTVTSTNTLSATASSGLSVSFSVVSGSASISGGTSLTFSDVGTVLIAATQVGGDNWDSVSVTNTYTVVHDTPIVGVTTVTRKSGDAGIKIADLDILANCIDPEGSALTISLTGSTTTNGGSVAMSGHWIFFTPKAGSDATDRFQIRVTNDFGNDTLGWVEVQVDAGTVRGLNYLNLELNNGNAILKFVGIPGRAYTVQTKTNITQGVWQNFTNVTVDSSGYVTFVHSNAPPTSFYRMVE